MKLAAMLNDKSADALKTAIKAAGVRKATNHQAYVLKCLRSKNIKEVLWARKQLNLHKAPPALAAPKGQKIQHTTTYKKLRVE